MTKEMNSKYKSAGNNIVEYPSLNKDTTEIVARAMTGDIDAYEELLKKYSKYIFSLVTGMTSTSNVEDVAQEVAIAIFKSITTLKSPYAFTSWLRTLTVNICRDYNDKEKRHAGRDTSIDSLIDVSETNPQNLPDRNFEINNGASLLYELINQLPESQRAALYLYYHEDMKYKDIAELLNISIATVGTNIIKAKNGLRKMLENNEHIKEDILASLKGAAVGPAIIGAFDYGASAHITDVALSKFSANVMNTCHAMGSNAGNQVVGETSKTSESTKALKVAVVVMLFAIIIAGVAGYYTDNISNEMNTDLIKSAPVEYKTVIYDAQNAEIIFEVTGDNGRNVDPISASLVLNDDEGMSQEWKIIDELGNTASSGEGEKFSVDTDLAPGKYTVMWDVANPDGAVSKISRDFYISE
jgi:RNA polymerase sigma-70 factor (ECF subfamily)